LIPFFITNLIVTIGLNRSDRLLLIVLIILLKSTYSISSISAAIRNHFVKRMD